MIVIDRFEGEIAVLESDGEMHHVARSSVPEQASEGDVITLLEDGSFTIDQEETARLRASVTSRLSALTLHRRGQERR